MSPASSCLTCWSWAGDGDAVIRTPDPAPYCTFKSVSCARQIGRNRSQSVLGPKRENPWYEGVVHRVSPSCVKAIIPDAESTLMSSQLMSRGDSLTLIKRELENPTVDVLEIDYPPAIWLYDLWQNKWRRKTSTSMCAIKNDLPVQ
jgi:hypothetical protein